MFTPMLIALFLTFTPVQADSAITVSGTVIDAQSEAVITSAKLTFTELETTVTLSEDGTFKVEGQLAGKHTVLIEAEGYVSKTVTLDVTESVELTIKLEKAVEENED